MHAQAVSRGFVKKSWPRSVWRCGVRTQLCHGCCCRASVSYITGGLSNMLGASWVCPDEEYSRLVGLFLVRYPSFLSISTKTSGNVTCLTPKSRMALSCWGLNHVVLFKGFLGSCVSVRSMEPCLVFDEVRNIPVIVVDHYHWRQHCCLTI